MKSLHDFLTSEFSVYQHWHDHSASNPTHWALFVVISCILAGNIFYTARGYAQTVDETASTTEQVVSETVSTSAGASADTSDSISTSTPPDTDQLSIATTTEMVTGIDTHASGTDVSSTTTTSNGNESVASSTMVATTSDSSDVVEERVASTTPIVMVSTENKTDIKVNTDIPKVLPKIISLNDRLVFASGSKQTDYVKYPISIIKKDGIDVTSSPAGISCGLVCVYSFVIGTKIVLTATQDDAQNILIWKGCESITKSTCTVTASSARTVTITTR